MNLYIIGNGFDKAHGLTTSYMDFRSYLENTDWQFLISLEEPYGYVSESKREFAEKYLWRDFENNLSHINEDEMIDGCLSLDMRLESGDVGIEDTLNIYWEDQYGYIQKLNNYIKLWAEQIDTHVPKKNWMKGNYDDLFLSFNYTLLLEEIYKVDPCQILHVHGSINEKDDFSPVIGHGNVDKILESKQKACEASEKFLEKETSIYNALANYYERTLKDVHNYLKLYDYFFDGLKLVDQVYVVGHSFGDVDLPYFKKVFESIQKNANWNIYYHSEGEDVTFANKIKSVGVNPKNFKILKSSLFFSKD